MKIQSNDLHIRPFVYGDDVVVSHWRNDFLFKDGMEGCHVEIDDDCVSTKASQSLMLPMKDVGRPFCVIKMRRCVSPTRFRHAARLLWHLEDDMMSSERRGVGNTRRTRVRERAIGFSFTLGISNTPCVAEDIVHDYVYVVKRANMDIFELQTGGCK